MQSIRPFVRAFMEEIAFGGELVVGPDLFDVNERALPLAKKKMLKCREREQLAFHVHPETEISGRT